MITRIRNWLRARARRAQIDPIAARRYAEQAREIVERHTANQIELAKAGILDRARAQRELESELADLAREVGLD